MTIFAALFVDYVKPVAHVGTLPRSKTKDERPPKRALTALSSPWIAIPGSTLPGPATRHGARPNDEYSFTI